MYFKVLDLEVNFRGNLVVIANNISQMYSKDVNFEKVYRQVYIDQCVYMYIDKCIIIIDEYHNNYITGKSIIVLYICPILPRSLPWQSCHDDLSNHITFKFQLLIAYSQTCIAYRYCTVHIAYKYWPSMALTVLSSLQTNNQNI